jgi:hypothetical protein
MDYDRDDDDSLTRREKIEGDWSQCHEEDILSQEVESNKGFEKFM